MRKANTNKELNDSILDTKFQHQSYLPYYEDRLPSSSPWWKRLLSFFVQFIIFLGFLVVFAVGIGYLFELSPLSRTRTIVGDFLYQWSIPFIASLLSIYLIDRLQQRKGMAAYGFSQNAIGKSLVTGLLFSSVILLFSFLILMVGGWAKVSNFDFQASLFFSWLLFFIIQPLTEEIIMRSFLQTQLHRHFGLHAGLIITALAFALMHGANNHITVIALIQIFAGGYLMGLLFLYTRNIWAAFAMHASWNFLQSTVLGFAVSGMETYRILETTTNGPDWLTGGRFGLEGSLLSLLLLVIGIVFVWNLLQKSKRVASSNDMITEIKP